MKVVVLVTQRPVNHASIEVSEYLKVRRLEFDAPLRDIRVVPVWAHWSVPIPNDNDVDVIGAVFDLSAWPLRRDSANNQRLVADLTALKARALSRGINFREYAPDLASADKYKLVSGESVLPVTDRDIAVLCVEGSDSRIHDANDFHKVWPNHVQDVSRWCYVPMEMSEDMPPVKHNFIVLDGVGEWSELSANLYARVIGLLASGVTVTCAVLWRRVGETEFHTLTYEDLVVPKSRSSRCMLIVSEDTLLSEKYVLPQGGHVMEISPFADGSRLTSRNSITHIVIDTRSRLHPSLADRLQELEERGVPTIRYSEGE